MNHASQLVDIVDENGKPVSTKKRQEIQKETDLYHTVFVILITPDKRLNLSKIPSRTDLPNLYAGLLGPTVSTIRRHGESADQASQRAIKNELYIDHVSLSKIDEYYTVLPDGHRKYMSVYYGMHEFPEDFSRSDIQSLHTFSEDELAEALKADQEGFALTFLAIWQKNRKDLF